MQHAGPVAGRRSRQHNGLRRDALIHRRGGAAARVADHNIAGRALAGYGSVPIFKRARPFEVDEYRRALLLGADHAKAQGHAVGAARRLARNVHQVDQNLARHARRLIKASVAATRLHQL